MAPIVIPPVILWTLGALGAAALAKMLAREWRRVNNELHSREPAPQEVVRDKMPTLKRDPHSGVYRPD